MADTPKIPSFVVAVYFDPNTGSLEILKNGGSYLFDTVHDAMIDTIFEKESVSRNERPPDGYYILGTTAWISPEDPV